MGLFWLVMGHVFHMISYVDCDVHCDMDSYMPGGGGMLTTDIEASRWSKHFVFQGLRWFDNGKTTSYSTMSNST
jgi:hypothetical protein